MERLAPSAFFALDHLEHPDLFPATEPVWAALGERLKRFLEAWSDWSIASEILPGVHVIGDRVAIGRGCRIEPGAVIVGPALIGDEVQIRCGAYVRENVVLASRSLVGAHSEVKGSILLSHAKAPHQAYVGDSILGCDVNLGAGTICSNVKNIGNEVTLRVEGEVVHTGLRKLGAILGDGCKTGCNTVLNPGVLMGPGSVTYPNATVRSGLYAARTLIKVRQQQQITELDRLR